MSKYHNNGLYTSSSPVPQIILCIFIYYIYYYLFITVTIAYIFHLQQTRKTTKYREYISMISPKESWVHFRKSDIIRFFGEQEAN